jgi:phage terminase small subunit
MTALKNAKHERFAQAIVEGKSGREAYQGAGYKAADAAADANASRLLTNAQVSARVAELKEVAATAAGLTAQKVLDELSRIAFANMADYMRVGRDGDPYLDFSKLTRDQAAALAEVTVEDFKDGRGKTARDVRKVRFKLADKLGALSQLGRYFGLFVDKHEHRGMSHEDWLTEMERLDEAEEAAAQQSASAARQGIAGS